MKRALYGVILSVAITILTVSSVLAQVDGFRGLKWGTEFSTVESEMEYKQTSKDGINYYRKLGDEMKIGKAELIELVYGFRENKFCSVLIAVKGQSNFEWLRDTTFERFGPPTNRERENLENVYLWLSDPNGKIRLAWITLGFGAMEIRSKHFAEPEAGF